MRRGKKCGVGLGEGAAAFGIALQDEQRAGHAAGQGRVIVAVEPAPGDNRRKDLGVHMTEATGAEEQRIPRAHIPEAHPAGQADRSEPVHDLIETSAAPATSCMPSNCSRYLGIPDALAHGVKRRVFQDRPGDAVGAFRRQRKRDHRTERVTINDHGFREMFP